MDHARSVVVAVVTIAIAACANPAPITVTSLASPPRPRPIPARPATTTLRVASYNVNFGLAGDPAGVRAIQRVGADVVLLQETNASWERAFDSAGYPYRRFGAPKGWPAGGMGVLSRYPIVSLEESPSVAGPFYAWRLVVAAPGGDIQLLDVHLHPPMSDGGSWVVGYFSTREDREHELAWHLARLDPKLPTVIAGDFNEEPDGRALALADARGFADAIAQFTGKRRTWEWPVGKLLLRFQLDHVLYDQRFVAVAGGIVEAGRSDHKPVWADLERVRD